MQDDLDQQLAALAIQGERRMGAMTGDATSALGAGPDPRTLAIGLAAMSATAGAVVVVFISFALQDLRRRPETARGRPAGRYHRGRARTWFLAQAAFVSIVVLTGNALTTALLLVVLPPRLLEPMTTASLAAFALGLLVMLFVLGMYMALESVYVRARRGQSMDELRSLLSVRLGKTKLLWFAWAACLAVVAVVLGSLILAGSRFHVVATVGVGIAAPIAAAGVLTILLYRHSGLKDIYFEQVTRRLKQGEGKAGLALIGISAPITLSKEEPAGSLRKILLNRQTEPPWPGEWLLPGGYFNPALDRGLGETVVRRVRKLTSDHLITVPVDVYARMRPDAPEIMAGLFDEEWIPIYDEVWILRVRGTGVPTPHVDGVGVAPNSQDHDIGEEDVIETDDLRWFTMAEVSTLEDIIPPHMYELIMYWFEGGKSPLACWDVGNGAV